MTIVGYNYSSRVLRYNPMRTKMLKHEIYTAYRYIPMGLTRYDLFYPKYMTYSTKKYNFTISSAHVKIARTIKHVYDDTLLCVLVERGGYIKRRKDTKFRVDQTFARRHREFKVTKLRRLSNGEIEEYGVYRKEKIMRIR